MHATTAFPLLSSLGWVGPRLAVTTPVTTLAGMSEDLRRSSTTRAGADALSRGDWQDAWVRFAAAAQQGGAAEALEWLSWAAWWLDDVDACIDARERAYRAYRDAGADRAAARMALWLADDHALADGDPEVALHHAREGVDAGQRHGRVDLEMFAVATEGVARLRLGEVDAGLRRLSEAATAALAGEYENLAPAAWSCCLLLATCEDRREYDRGVQWCEQVAAFSERTNARFLRAVCSAHYGAILAWYGRLEEAEGALVAAGDAISEQRPTWRPEALVRLGQLRRQVGLHRRHGARLHGAPSSYPMRRELDARTDRTPAGGATDLGHGRLLRHRCAPMPAPPDFVDPPLGWGEGTYVQQLFDGTRVRLRFDRGHWDITHDSVEAAVECYPRLFGPLPSARQLAGEEGRWPAFEADLTALFERLDTTGGTEVTFPAEYLVTLGAKAG